MLCCSMCIAISVLHIQITQLLYGVDNLFLYCIIHNISLNFTNAARGYHAPGSMDTTVYHWSLEAKYIFVHFVHLSMP